MPSCARSEIIDPTVVGIYHCWSRCVRRAFLCGHDPVSGKDYNHRRLWIWQMQRLLAGLFAIEVCFRSEMTNHIHLVLRNRPDVVKTWSDREVVVKWLTATKLAKSKDGIAHEPSAARVKIELLIPGRVKVLRTRLAHPSEFMGILCEHISRRSNREDECTGAFWDDRYKCRNLIDEASILVCGIYVDLNPIRAGEAQTPETSKHTSAYDRIRTRQLKHLAAKNPTKPFSGNQAPDSWMCELTLDQHMPVNDPRCTSSASARRASDKGLLTIDLDDYLKLLDASGRIVRDGKKGAIPDHLQPILDRLGVRAEMWGTLVNDYHQMFGNVVGSATEVSRLAAKTGKRWRRGKANCEAAFLG